MSPAGATEPPPEPAPARTPRRAAVVALALACLAIPAGVLAWSLGRDGGSPSSGSPGGLERATLRGPAPDFRLETLDGGTVALDDYAGRPLVLAFMASWCAPCEEEIPVLAAALRDRPGEFAVVSIMYRDLESDARSFLAEHGAEWPAARDAGGVAERYRVGGLPVTFFIDAEGTIVEQSFGITSAAALAEPLDALLDRS